MNVINGWLSSAHKRDLRNLDGGRGNGPFNGQARGVVLHVNASGKGSQGTSADWYAAGGGSDSVCPNFQVMADGTIWQFLPIDWQPWTQMNGNSWGPSIETGGDPSEPLTDAQIASCAVIYRACAETLGLPYRVANSPAERGLGTHGMGGANWGGHTGCPGPIRAGQRNQIVALAQNPTPDPTSFLEYLVSLDRNSDAYKQAIDDIAAAVWAQQFKSLNDGKKYSAGNFVQSIDRNTAPKAGK